MNTKKRNLLVAVLITILTVAMVFTAGVLFGRKGGKTSVVGRAERTLLESFAAADGITVLPEETLTSGAMQGKKGYLLQTKKSGASVELGSSMSGRFSADFTPVASKSGESDFAGVSFGFSSDSSRLSFVLHFLPAESGVLMRLSVSNYANRYQESLVDGSFTNTSANSVRFSFDPEKMVVYNASGYTLFDLRSDAFRNYYKTTTVFPSFEEYTVKVTVDGVKSGATAQIMLFELCGLRLENKKLVNTAAPVLCETPVLNNGVCGTAYTVRKDVRTYNILEGFKKDFEGDIVVVNEKNEPIALENGSFTPTAAGTYQVQYTPKNSDGISGTTTSAPFYVFEKQPEVEFSFAYPVSDAEIGKDTRVSFPAVVGVSRLSDERLKVSASIEKEGKTVFSVADCRSGFDYIFAELGVYDVQYTCIDVSGYEANATAKYTVSDTPIFMGAQFDAVYFKGATVSFSGVYATYGGVEYKDVNVTTVYPSGNSTTSKVVVLKEEGVYEINFSCLCQNSQLVLTKYITARQDNNSLWVEQEGLSVQSEAIAPDYADAAYEGTMLTVSRPLEAVYKNVIDLSDNTSEVLLCELFVSPKTAGAIETGCIDIILTDVHNEENVVDIKLTRPAWYVTREEDKRSMSVIALTQRDFTIDTLSELYPFEPNSKYQHYYYYTRSISSTFYGQIANDNECYPSQSVRLFFDYAKGVLYAEMASANGQFGKVAVVDLTDENYVGIGNAWKGFTTGEAQFSIRISELAQTANVLMINVDGQNLSGEYTKDVTAPSIFLDYKGNSENHLPVGVVNKPYAIFEGYTRDAVDGLGTKIDVSVYKRIDGEWKHYERQGMQFIPDEAGEYKLRYETTDESGNVGVKEVVITVVEEADLAPIQYYFNGSMRRSASVGERYVVLKGKAKGGSGVISQEVEVFFGNEKITLDENNAFFIAQEGEYRIVVRLSDYLGESGTDYVLKMTASYSAAPLILEATLPRVLVQGETVELPAFTAKTYSANGVDDVPVQLAVSYDGENYDTLDSLLYTPTQSGKLYVKVTAGANELVREIQVNAAISPSEKSGLYSSQYLYAEVAPQADTAMFYTFEKEAKISLARKIDVRFVDFDVCVRSGDGFSTLKFTLTDSLNPAIAVTGAFIKNDESSSYFELNGQRYYVSDSSFFNENLSFGVSFDYKTGMIVIGNKSVAKVLRADNGDVFHGFTSGNVYIDFAFAGVSGEYTVGVKSIAGQDFKKAIKNDNVGPAFKLLDDLNNSEKGEKLIVPQAAAFDFSGIASVCVTVTSPSGKVLFNAVDISQNSLEITAEEVGLYKLKYVATDLLGKKATRNRSINVADRVPPTITLAGTVAETAKVNKKLSIPLATVSDDNTSAEDIVFYVYAISPDGKMTILNYCIDVKGKKMSIEEYKTSDLTGGVLVAKENYDFIADQKGLYVIVYFAQDAHAASTTLTYRVRVS